MVFPLPNLKFNLSPKNLFEKPAAKTIGVIFLKEKNSFLKIAILF